MNETQDKTTMMSVGRKTQTSKETERKSYKVRTQCLPYGTNKVESDQLEIDVTIWVTTNTITMVTGQEKSRTWKRRNTN